MLHSSLSIQSLSQIVNQLNSKLLKIVVEHTCIRQEVIYYSIGLGKFNNLTSVFVSELGNISYELENSPIKLITCPYLYQVLNNWFVVFCRYRWNNRMGAETFIHKHTHNQLYLDIPGSMKMLEIMIAYDGDMILDYQDIQKYIYHSIQFDQLSDIQKLSDHTKLDISKNLRLNSIIDSDFNLESVIAAFLRSLHLESALYVKVLNTILDKIYVAFNVSETIEHVYLLAVCIASCVPHGEERDQLIGNILQYTITLQNPTLLTEIAKFEQANVYLI